MYAPSAEEEKTIIIPLLFRGAKQMNQKRPKINVGDIFGDIKVIEVLPSSASLKSNSSRCKVQCLICGKEKIMLRQNILRGVGITHKDPLIKIGDIIGDMKVLEKVPQKKGKKSAYKVRCNVCGKEHIKDVTSLTHSIGVKHNNIIEIHTGDLFGDMKIIKRAKEKFSDRKIRYEVVCTKCGRKKIMTKQRIVNGLGTSHKSCSYSIGEYSKRFNDIWRGIRDRTTNPNCSVYYNYGAKGIKSDAFKYFADFYDSMYSSYCEAIERYGDEKIISIDRINVYGDYTPENCRWISLDEQKGNRRNNHWFKAKSPEHDLFIEQNLSRFQRSFGVDRHKIAECLRGDRDSYHGWTFAFLNAEETKKVNKDISLHHGNVYIGKKLDNNYF